jgi:hypothetical protein
MRLKRISDLARFFYLQRVKGFDVPAEPWLDDETRAWLDRRLTEIQTYLEFGSGGSTRLIADLDIEATSVECDRFFARAVRNTLPADSKVTILDADIGPTAAWGVPLPGTPTPGRVGKWRRYVDIPFEHLSYLPELVLIDGRFRRACALRCAMAAREYGTSASLLFDDYYMDGRSTYQSIESLLGVPERIGKAAHFIVAPDYEIYRSDVELALEDYR